MAISHYANRTRRARSPQIKVTPLTITQSPTRKTFRKQWAQWLQQVFEVNPPVCSQCGHEMRITAFIQKDQSKVIEKISIVELILGG